MTAIPHAAPVGLVSEASRDGLRDMAPMLLAIFPFALAIGVAAAEAGLGLGTGLTAAFLIYGGAAYLAVLAMLGTGATVAMAALTAALVNARLLLYGAAMAERFRDQPAWFRWLAPHIIVDQTYVVAAARSDLLDPARFRRYWLAAGAALTTVWLLGNAVGLWLGPVLPDNTPLDVTRVVLFVGLLVPKLGDRVARLTAAVAAAVAVVASGLPNGSGLVLAIVCGIAVSVVATRGRGSR